MLVSCSSAKNTPKLLATPSVLLKNESPIISPIPYQPNVSPLLANNKEIVAFELEKPVLEGQQDISGRGTSNVPILLQDITLDGELLASAVIDSNGEFVISLREPLQSGHRIGVRLGELGETSFSEEYFRDYRFNGSESRNIPQLGFFFDTALVR